jgi:thiamine kinase-like enzyme
MAPSTTIASRTTGLTLRGRAPSLRPVQHPDPLLDAAIDAVPGWSGRGDANVTPIEEGRTNRNFRVEVGGEAYFLRLSDRETELLGIDRMAEHSAALAAAAAGVGPEVVAFLPMLGCLVTRWVPGLPLAEGDLEDVETLERAVKVVRTIHGCPALQSSFSAFRIVEDYRRIAQERGVVVPDAFEAAHAMASRIEEGSERAPVPDRPCHNDLLAPNFIRGDDAMWLVDHEYAGMGDPYFDLGNLSINNGLSEDAQERLLQLYFGEVTNTHRARLGLMRIMSDFREAMWGVVQQGLSTLDIDYVAYAQTHFDRLAVSMTDPRFERWLADAAGTI